jgi:hypothetical protein
LHVLSTPPAFVLSQDQTLRECSPVTGSTPRERNPPRNNRKVHSILAVLHFKGTLPQTTIGRERGINISGVDFWHAVEFSRNGHFLRTHPQNTLRGFPPGASLRSCIPDSIRPFPYPISSVPSRSPLPRFPFQQFRLYQTLSGLIPSQRGLPSRPPGRSDE